MSYRSQGDAGDEVVTSLIYRSSWPEEEEDLDKIRTWNGYLVHVVSRCLVACTQLRSTDTRLSAVALKTLV